MHIEQMEIKGTAVKSIYEFVQKKFPDRLKEWIDELPEASRKIMEEAIFATQWYPLDEAGGIPTKKLGLLFYDDIKKGAWECGRFSAEMALTGVYKVFIKLATPSYIIDRATKIFSTYYRPTELSVVDKGKNSVKLHIQKFPSPDRVIEYRIAGWMERALEINNCKNINMKIPQSLTLGHPVTEINITWD